MRKEIVSLQGKEIEVMKINNDINGNPRCVVHFADIGIHINDYDNINKLYGFKKYRSKSYGGGIVFQAWSIKESLKYMIDEVKRKK